MSAFKSNGCLWVTHSRYYSQWVGNLPYVPFIYWNVHTHDDIIPVCTYGYKTLKSAQKQIASYISDVKEYKMIHIETEEEHDTFFQKNLQNDYSAAFEENDDENSIM
jgi:hypothetical protein